MPEEDLREIGRLHDAGEGDALAAKVKAVIQDRPAMQRRLTAAGAELVERSSP